MCVDISLTFCFSRNCPVHLHVCSHNYKFNILLFLAIAQYVCMCVHISLTYCFYRNCPVHLHVCSLTFCFYSQLPSTFACVRSRHKLKFNIYFLAIAQYNCACMCVAIIISLTFCFSCNFPVCLAKFTRPLDLYWGNFK